MIESALTGIIQGITEWLPVSSEGMIVLFTSMFFPGQSLSEMIKYALFLHMGTFFAALIYFRKDVIKLLKTFFKYHKAKAEDKKALNFILSATLISGIIAIIIMKSIIEMENIAFGAKGIIILVGLMLLVTGFMQLKSKKKGIKKERNLKAIDGIIVGFAQGLSIIPGISRSGMTVSTLLLRKFDDTEALRLSFLMSLPIVLLGNVFLNADKMIMNMEAFVALLLSFIFGILTINVLMKISKKINFAYFAIFFAVLILLTTLI